MQKLLQLLQKDARMSVENLATILGKKPVEIEKEIKKLVEEKTILGFKTIINPKIKDRGIVQAVIEVKVVPTRGKGFDEVALRIARFPEVKTVQLVSGSFDLLVVAEGKSLPEVARFISEKLATIDKIQGTKTNFLLKTYKEDGIFFTETESSQRLAVTA